METLLLDLDLAREAAARKDDVVDVGPMVSSRAFHVRRASELSRDDQEDVVCQAALVNVGMDVLANADWFGEPASGIVSGLLVISLLYLLLRLPFAAYGWAFRQSSMQNRVVHSAVLGARSLAAL